MTLSAALVILAIAPSTNAASVLTINLGGAAGYGILSGAGITIAGPANSSSVAGNIGSYPTPAITGLENLLLTGTNLADGAVTQAASGALVTAYNDAASRVATTSFGDGHNLTGTVEPGVIKSAGSFSLNGTVFLDAAGDSSSVWIFQMVSSLTTASSSQVVLLNGALASNVFWQVGSSATLGGSSNFAGTILAMESISLGTGTVVQGAALARTGSVTLTSSSIAVPEPGTFIMAGLAAALSVFRKRR